jgi:hypothetical protein
MLRGLSFFCVFCAFLRPFSLLFAALGENLVLVRAFRPSRRLAEPEQHLAGFRYQKNPFVFAIGKIFGADLVRISVTKIDFPAELGGKASGQSDSAPRSHGHGWNGQAHPKGNF